MENETINYSKKEYLKLLKKHFGPYKQEGAYYKFSKWDNRDIAKELLIDPAHFTRLLKEDRFSYKIDIERVLLYADAKAYRESRFKRNQLRNIYLAVIMFLGVIILILLFQPFQRQQITFDQKHRTELYLDPAPKFEDVTDYLGDLNEISLKYRGTLVNHYYRNLDRALTARDTIEAVEKIQGIVMGALDEGRTALKRLNFKCPSGTTVVDSIRMLFPLEDTLIFKLDKTDILKYHDVDNFPKHATSYDKGVFEAVPFIINNEIDPQKLGDELDRINKKVIRNLKQKLTLSHLKDGSR